MTPNANEPARVKRKVFWLLLILVAVISLGFMVLGSQPLDQQLASIGANILAAAAYAAVFTLLLERESQTWLDSRLGERLDAKFDAQQQWLERRQAEHEAAVELTIGGGPLAPFAPSQVFEGRNVFDRGFLEAITDEMRESQQLWFRGSAGKFLAPYVTGLGLRPSACTCCCWIRAMTLLSAYGPGTWPPAIPSRSCDSEWTICATTSIEQSSLSTAFAATARTSRSASPTSHQ